MLRSGLFSLFLQGIHGQPVIVRKIAESRVIDDKLFILQRRQFALDRLVQFIQPALVRRRVLMVSVGMGGVQLAHLLVDNVDHDLDPLGRQPDMGVGLPGLEGPKGVDLGHLVPQ
ncbi:hypothetical protein SDC9_207146 [bioreactor metagenome]|uniref:Uncharacterized protein n=1 Tax=bioreactor metagenome TaxID=1076179 RepID=A0A645J6T2_9ZZZZ